MYTLIISNRGLRGLYSITNTRLHFWFRFKLISFGIDMNEKTYAKRLGEAKNISYIYGINKVNNIKIKKSNGKN